MIYSHIISTYYSQRPLLFDIKLVNQLYPIIMSAPSYNPPQYSSSNGQSSMPPSYDSSLVPSQCAPTSTVDSTPVLSWDDVRLNRFREVCMQYEISNYFAGKLRQLEGTEIYLIGDDSGSMTTPMGPQSAFGKAVTRWDILKKIFAIVVDIAATMDKNGLDVIYLNRGPNNNGQIVIDYDKPPEKFSNITQADQLDVPFSVKPTGRTPLTPVLAKILTEIKERGNEQRTLVFIGTDGVPTNYDGEPRPDDLEALLKDKKLRDPTGNIYCTFLACTDNLEDVAHLNGWDKKIGHVDVVASYEKEKAEILKKKGNGFAFSMGDYIVKSLIGAIDPEWDKLDESDSE